MLARGLGCAFRAASHRVVAGLAAPPVPRGLALRGLCVTRASGLTSSPLSPLPRVGAVKPLSTLVLPAEAGPLAVNAIRDNFGARKKSRRVGRGVGSSKGRTCGRGHKGQKARSGNHGLLYYEGGQTKLTKRVPKSGFHRPAREYTYINLDTLQASVQSGRLPLPDGRPLGVADLVAARLLTLRQRHAGLKLLGRGAGSFSTPLRIEVQDATRTAIEAVEAAGGSIETVYYSRLTLRALLKPHKFGSANGKLPPRPALPPPRLMRDIYMSEAKRGYLRNLAPGDVVRAAEHPAHVDLALRLADGPRYPGWEAAKKAAERKAAEEGEE